MLHYLTLPISMFKKASNVLKCFLKKACLFGLCNEKHVFFFSLMRSTETMINYGHIKMFVKSLFTIWTMYILISNKLYRPIVGIPMGTNCAPLVAVADCFILSKKRL